MPEIKIKLTHDQTDTLYSLLNEQEGENLIDMQRESLIDRIIDMTDRIGADRMIDKLNGLDLAAHPGLTADDREALIGLIEVAK